MARIIARRIPLLLTILMAASVVLAQSGRRGTPKPTAPPTPPVASPAEPEKKPDEAKKLQLLVAIEDPSVFENVPYYLVDTVLAVCFQRFGEPKGVVPTLAPERMSRSDSVKKAKTETSRFVVWLRVVNERESYGADVSTRSDQLYVSYVILEPVTGKIKAAGRSYYRANRVGNVEISAPPRTSPLYTEYVLKQSARDAADRILAEFGIRAGRLAAAKSERLAVAGR